MRVYFFDSEFLNAFAGVTPPFDLDYQAEMYVKEVVEDGKKRKYPIIAFVLCDGDGIRCVWERSVEEAAGNKLPAITRVAERFTGEWERTVNTTPTIEPASPYDDVLAYHKARS